MICPTGLCRILEFTATKDPHPSVSCNTPLSVGLSQAKRQILSKGLASNAATLLDFPPGDSNGASPSSLVPSASDLFAGGPAKGSSSKRKRLGSVDESSSGLIKKASTEYRHLFGFYFGVCAFFFSVCFCSSRGSCPLRAM